MSRSRFSALVAGSLAVGALGLLPLAGTASAEPTSTPAVTDIVGVGSDTTQFAMNYLIDGALVNGTQVDGYNHGRTSALLQSFDAAGSGLTASITPKQGAGSITRPNGSGAGKALLYGAGNNASIDYARSSSSLSTDEVSAGLWQVPFAVDGLKMAVDATSTHAPASIAATDVVKIYNGTYTDWAQLGGTAGTIAPLIPQAGSGTRKFFLDQLKAANGGVDVTLAASVQETQEHSDTDLKANPDAIAPFSTGRAKTTPTIELLGGFNAKRALYNVVRAGDLGKAWFSGIFGETGFICSSAAKSLIEHAGFDQLARSNGTTGVCGEATQAATTDFATNDGTAHATTSKVTGTATGQKVSLKVTVSSDVTPAGQVRVLDGTKTVATKFLQGGVGLVSLSGVTPGTHSYKAVYTPASDYWTGSTSAAKSLAVKGASRTTVSMPSTFSTTRRVKATISVTTLGKPASGKVVVRMGTHQIAAGTLSAGQVTVLLPRLAKGKHTLTFAYLGNARTAASKVTKTVTVTR